MKKFNGSRGFSLPDLLVLLIILAVVSALWYGSSYWIDTYVTPQGTTETINQARGTFGDKFGAINSLFSGFAFAAIIFTIILQNRELNDTRAAMREQSATVNSQRFDTTFFQLLGLHNDITSKLRDLQHAGRHAFEDFHERLVRSDLDFPAFYALQKLERDDIRIIKDNREAGNFKIPDKYHSRLADADISNIEVLLEKGIAFCDNFLDVVRWSKVDASQVSLTARKTVLD